MRLRYRLAAAVAVLGSAAAFAASGRWPWPRLHEYQRSLSAEPAEVALMPAAWRETQDTLRRGETISELLARHGIVDLDLSRLGVLDPRRLRAGLVFNLRRLETDSATTHVSVRTGPEERVLFRRDTAGWDAEATAIRWTPETIRLEGDIDASLYEALDGSVPDEQLGPAERVRLAWDLADVFAWQIDFSRDIQPGDHYKVLVERLVSEEGEVRFGRVLAGHLQVNGRDLTAFRFAAAGGAERFYDTEGNSLRRAFLRAPVAFRRISSTFNRSRRHPVLGITRRHEGTDYAASPGTDVMAAGDGVVIRAGRAGGYGNLVELRHRNGITTRYGHLRAFARGIRTGARVGQGQVIGYVGSTGLASGPHLHYEFRVNGVAKDSRRVELGNGAPVDRAARAAFDAERDRLAALLYGAPSVAFAR